MSSVVPEQPVTPPVVEAPRILLSEWAGRYPIGGAPRLIGPTINGPGPCPICGISNCTTDPHQGEPGS